MAMGQGQWQWVDEQRERERERERQGGPRGDYISESRQLQPDKEGEYRRAQREQIWPPGNQ